MQAYKILWSVLSLWFLLDVSAMENNNIEEASTQLSKAAKAIEDESVVKTISIEKIVPLFADIHPKEDRLSIVGELVLHSKQLSLDDKIKLTQKLQQGHLKLFNLCIKNINPDSKEYVKLCKGVNLLEFFEKIMKENKESLNNQQAFSDGANTNVSHFQRALEAPRRLLSLAAEFGNGFTVKFLLKAGASIDEEVPEYVSVAQGEWNVPLLMTAIRDRMMLSSAVVHQLANVGAEVTDDIRAAAKERSTGIKGRIKTFEGAETDANEKRKASLAMAKFEQEQVINILHELGITDIES